jgi:hypothetical protein
MIRIFAAAASAGLLALSMAGPAQAAPTGAQARGPLDKVPTGSLAYVDEHDLIITGPRAGGGGTIAFYEAVESGQTLLDQLKAQGVVERSIQVKNISGQASVGAVPPGPGDPTTRCASNRGLAAFIGPVIGGVPNCSLGNRVNWRHNGFADPQVYFRDHTPSRWPVTAAVRDWNLSPGIDSYYTSGSCPTGGRHCVHVWNANYGGTVGWYGYTYVEYDSAYFFIDGLVVVHYNDFYAANANLDRSTTCHELGHALGLHHNGSLASCLYTPRSTSRSLVPHQSDYDTLAQVVYPL